MIVADFFSVFFDCHMRHMNIDVNQYDHHQVHVIRIKMEMKK